MSFKSRIASLSCVWDGALLPSPRARRRPIKSSPLLPREEQNQWRAFYEEFAPKSGRFRLARSGFVPHIPLGQGSQSSQKWRMGTLAGRLWSDSNLVALSEPERELSYASQFVQPCVAIKNNKDTWNRGRSGAAA